MAFSISKFWWQFSGFLIILLKGNHYFPPDSFSKENMNKIDVIDLTKKLIRFDTKNLPGNERAIAEYCSAIITAYQ
jgi:hypothetical protein